MRVNRAKALRGKCPTCNAPGGTPCIGSHGQERVALHLDRWDAAFKRELKRMQREDAVKVNAVALAALVKRVAKAEGFKL